MNQDDLPEHAKQALSQWRSIRSRRDQALAARGPSPVVGDVFALPCHAGVSPSWLVVEELPGGDVRLAPGDDRPWSNAGDLWVGDDGMCLRLGCCVTLPASLLPVGQRIGVLPDAPRAVVEHESARRFAAPDPVEEDEDQSGWRRSIARAARMLPRFLRDGVAALRLSEFACEDGSPASGTFARESDDAGLSVAPLAADSSSLEGRFLKAVGASRGEVVLHELDVECEGTVQLVASRAGLGVVFRPRSAGAQAPVLMVEGRTERESWSSLGGTDDLARIFINHDWHQPLLLHCQAARSLPIEIVDDLWYR